VRATSANSASRAAGFTLLEIIIALVLVAILISASLPYLFDSYASAEGDRASEAITGKARDTRLLAIQKGEMQRLILTPSGIKGMALPSGWTLEVKGLNDSKFHSPGREQAWNFSSAGICEPLVIRLRKGDKTLETSFDALTAQPLHDDN